MLTLPFADLPAFTETVVLDGTTYRLSFAWNFTGGYWSLTVADAADNPLLQGIRITLNLDLFGRFPGRGLPPGQLLAVEPSDRVQEPGYADLSSGRVSLVYLTEADLAAAV